MPRLGGAGREDAGTAISARPIHDRQQNDDGRNAPATTAAESAFRSLTGAQRWKPSRGRRTPTAGRMRLSLNSTVTPFVASLSRVAPDMIGRLTLGSTSPDAAERGLGTNI